MPQPRYTTQDALDWKARYEAGQSIEQIHLDTGASTITVRRWLHAVGTEMRAASRLNRGNPKPKPKPSPSRAVKTVLGRHSLSGHRRRGRY